jgi:hypothetical protein
MVTCSSNKSGTDNYFVTLCSLVANICHSIAEAQAHLESKPQRYFNVPGYRDKEERETVPCGLFSQLRSRKSFVELTFIGGNYLE